ncbi:uncharacterized protein LOC126088346 [Schistocerca cancellata]|uniref:uncharacterized protein LOC126088346 n=1 Tax=Schistocerca cancellata TaxID=274614 RepID=UPI002119681F|nr:uncharacterized protein LOC126088346 [Schistocerca cancellata]
MAPTATASVIVGNGRSLRYDTNSGILQIVGNGNKIRVRSNSGCIQVTGNDSRVLVEQNGGSVCYTGNGGKVRVVATVGGGCVTYTGSGGRVKAPVATPAPESFEDRVSQDIEGGVGRDFAQLLLVFVPGTDRVEADADISDASISAELLLVLVWLLLV